MAGKGVEPATSPVIPIPGIDDSYYDSLDFSATQVGISKGLGAIFGAYTEYEAGKMRELAYNHKAAMAEINAKMIESETTLLMAEKSSKLRESLAMQNVIAAAQGRARGGSVSAIEQTSRARFAKEERRTRQMAKGKKVSELMSAGIDRATGKAAARQGLLRATTTGIGEGIEAARYIV